MTMFRDIKINYMEFLSSLKYENMAEKVSNSRNKKKTQETAKTESWHEVAEKEFSFEDEVVNQNAGLYHFTQLLENIKKLEDINYELLVKFKVKEGLTAGKEEIQTSMDMLEHIEKGLLAAVGGGASYLPRKDSK